MAMTDTQQDQPGARNILFITVDQEHFFTEYPEGTRYKARKLLEELGTTFENHYACAENKAYPTGNLCGLFPVERIHKRRKK